MAKENLGWGAERIRGELLKLQIEVSKSTIQKYMSQVRGPADSSLQTWLTAGVLTTQFPVSGSATGARHDSRHVLLCRKGRQHFPSGCSSDRAAAPHQEHDRAHSAHQEGHRAE